MNPVDQIKRSSYAAASPTQEQAASYTTRTSRRIAREDLPFTIDLGAPHARAYALQATSSDKDDDERMLALLQEAKHGHAHALGEDIGPQILHGHDHKNKLPISKETKKQIRKKEKEIRKKEKEIRKEKKKIRELLTKDIRRHTVELPNYAQHDSVHYLREKCDPAV